MQLLKDIRLITLQENYVQTVLLTTSIWPKLERI